MVTNNSVTQPIDVRRYDTVVDILVKNPGISFEDAAERAGVSQSTVRKIWEGTISRPPIVVLEKLEKPRRCQECGALCSDWPCVLCEIKRRTPSDPSRRSVARFMYKRQKK